MMVTGNVKGTESEFSRSSAPSSKESKKTVKEKGKNDEPVMDEGFKKGFKPDESSFLPEIKTGIEECDNSTFRARNLVMQFFLSHSRYNDVWKTKDESANLKQLHYEDMIIHEKYSEVEMELRKIVDEMMRHELDLLQVGFLYIYPQIEIEL